MGSWRDPSGYDEGKKIRGRKRHILVDTLGLLLNTVVHPAVIQDRDGAFHLLRRALRPFPFIERIFADGGYAGRKMAMTVWRSGAWSLQIVKRSDAAGFEGLAKRWITATFGKVTWSQRIAKEVEAITPAVLHRGFRLIERQPGFCHHCLCPSQSSRGSVVAVAWLATSNATQTTVAAFIRLAMIRIMLRRLAANASTLIQTNGLQERSALELSGFFSRSRGCIWLSKLGS